MLNFNTMHPDDVEGYADMEPVTRLDGINRHLEQNADNIEREAQAYAKSFKVSIEDARRDVSDEYIQGYIDAAEAARYE